MIRLMKIASLCTVAMSGLSVAVRADERPNIVFLMADDQSKYSMGCYDTPNARTPNLDQLAADGLVFERHYATTAICMASRASIVTGMLEFKHGCNFETGPLAKQHWQQSYPVLLRKAGYRTAFAGKIGFEIAEQHGQKPSLPISDFDEWGAGPGQTSYVTAKNKSMEKYAQKYPHSTRSYGAFGRDFILKVRSDHRPFCLSVSFKAPHHPVRPDPIDAELFRGQTYSQPGNFGREAGAHFSLQSRQGRQFQRFHSWNYSSAYDETMSLYFQQIYAIDIAVGMIRKAIADAGVSDNTVIIYTSDNGFMNGAHGYGSKVLPYEESSCVPLIVFDPRHQNSFQNQRCDALTGNIDIAATILDLAGLPQPADYDGYSLMTLYQDARQSVHESLPLINVWGPEAVHSLAVVTTQAKYIVWPYSQEGFERTEELYNMVTDRLELSNEVSFAEIRLQRMQVAYTGWVEAWKTHAVSQKYAMLGEVFRRMKRDE